MREHERLRTQQQLGHSVSDDELSSGSGGASSGAMPSVAVGTSSPTATHAHAPAHFAATPTGAASISPTNSGTLGGGPMLKSAALV